MVELDGINKYTSPVDDEFSFEYLSLRDAFFEWLSAGNSKKYPAEAIVSCIDKISEYAVLKKISVGSIWKYKKNDVFKPIYNKLLQAKLLRIIDRKAYKVFIVAGKLYLRFLKDRPWKTIVTETIKLAVSDVDDEAIGLTMNESAALVKKEQLDTDSVVLSQDLAKTTLVFKKEVDWSLLNYGFTIPKPAIDTFCSNIDGEVLRGSSLHIKLMVGKDVYPATLSNVGFSSDKRKQLQVRYSATSRAAVALREIFRSSYNFMMAKKNNCASNMKLKDKEYIDVVCVSSGIYGLICYPLISELQLEMDKSPKEIIQETKLPSESGLDENKLVVKGYAKEINTPENNNVKVGLYIRSRLRQLSELGFTFSEQQLRNICDLQWSKETFRLATPHPFAKISDGSIPLGELVKNANGYNRYWNQVFAFGDVELVFISQWYERNRRCFDEWFATLDLGLMPVDASLYDYTCQQRSSGKKYEVLKDWLVENGSNDIRWTFDQVSRIVGGLPPSAYKYLAFWANTYSHPFAVAWMEAGYRVFECDLYSQVVHFTKSEGEVENTYTRRCRKTVKAALIEFSNNYKGEIKTRREIVEELSAKYGNNEYSILPADYEIGLNNGQPKLFKRIDHGTYLCLGYDTEQTGIAVLSRNQVDGYSLISVDEKSKLIGIVADKFKNGFRMSSSIDFERFKNYYVDEYGKEFQYAADRLHYVLSNEALVFDDRAYVYGEDVSDTVRMYLEQMNSPCIYIDAFFNKFSDELYAFTIFSIDMLRAFIEKNYYDISVKWDYILLQESTSPSELIKDVFGERETWSVDELQERLPCLKMDSIRQILNGAEYYRVDKGTYTHIDNMDLPESEGEKIIAFVVRKLQERDYVTANELDLSKFENLNPHCSFAAVRDAVFYKFLSNRYDKSGQVITMKGGKLRVLDIIEQYCREANAVSFDELNAFEATFDPGGRTHSQCLIAGHNTMVRVSSDLFVSDGNVDFDVARIDEAITLYCHGNFIPLRGVTDFSLFPYAGYHWNLFLLESYVRRFSHVFKYDVRAVNSANIGAIVRKSFEYNDYDDILSLALAKSSVRLSDKKAVGDYLFNNGYIGWRNLCKSEGKIIKSARELREGDTV